MSITCGYDAEAQDAVERGAERFPVFCHDCGQRIPFHFSHDRMAELQAQVKMLTCGSAMIDLYEEIKRREQ